MSANIASWLYQRALKQPESLAIITDQQAYTYAQARHFTGILAAHFRANGVAPGQVVGVSMVTNPLHFLVILALAQIGAISLPLHPAVPRARRLLAARRFGAQSVVSGRSELALEGLDFIGLESVDFEVDSRTDESIHPVTDDTPMRIALSSGTSGDPKGMMLTHGLMAERMRTPEAGAGPDSRTLAMDLNFIVGFRPAMSAMARGAALVFPQSAAAEHILQSMLRHRVTHAYFSPAQVRDILALTTDGISSPDLVCLRVGGGFVNAALWEETKARLGRHVYASYGSTESGMVSYATPEMLARKPDTAGRICAYASAEVVDAEGNQLPVGVTGQLRIRSSHQVKGYFRNDERTARHFRDDWFYPGDLAHFDKEGLFYIDGRLDEQINIGGSMINPDDIEDSLAAHPAVMDAGVFAAHDGASEVCAAAMVLNDDSRLDDVRRYAIAQLGPLAPARYWVMSALPRTETGKLKRNELTNLYSE